MPIGLMDPRILLFIKIFDEYLQEGGFDEVWSDLPLKVLGPATSAQGIDQANRSDNKITTIS